MTRPDIFIAIEIERHRQERLCASGKFKHTCASNEISLGLKYAILGEEFGEVGKEVCEMLDRNDFSPEKRAQLRAELIQLAAVAVAWLETPEPKQLGEYPVTAVKQNFEK